MKLIIRSILGLALMAAVTSATSSAVSDAASPLPHHVFGTGLSQLVMILQSTFLD